ncbi:mannose-6-phosphate isomerase type 1 [Haloactinospora alba]|uniref:mannose-6-phosphate isomerase n=1 Tax=Haloactinospora alba TaxID=405555 RepID=A0A543NK07_9ACTN|nr:mannose-6-phosphate isomerase, class I [Haloactinospora alba]TQN32159.1 mannose-6-phosphate isomerase type 1 [Haloactinospora alba]
MYRLNNYVRRYAWGSTTVLPRLLGEPPDGTPQAELWVGAHPSAPSSARTPDGPVPLDRVIAAQPERMLGKRAARSFEGRLPFLLKVLAAEAPLSLQAHPTAGQARTGYAAEEAAGVPADAEHRNYPDPRHKPEMLLALGRFEALCGFRAPEEVLGDLRGFQCELARVLRSDLASGDAPSGLRAALTRLLTLSPGHRNELVTAFTREWQRRGRGTHADVIPELARRYPGDAGAAAALLLRRVTLERGQALYLPAGNVHSYLGGTAVEVMANSDNVLRAGLTGKHVDPSELLRVVDFSARPVPYVPPSRGDGILEYRTPAPEVALSAMGPGTVDGRLTGGTPWGVLVLEGNVELRSRAGGVRLGGGGSAFVPAHEGEVRVAGEGYLVAATVCETEPAGQAAPAEGREASGREASGFGS